MGGDSITSSIIAAVEWLARVLLFFGGAVGGVLAGLVYFAKSDRSAPVWQRTFASAYGPVAAILFVAALLLPQSQLTQQNGVRYLWLQVLPGCLFVYSLLAYPGRRQLHVWLVPLAILSWLWVALWGFVLIHGE